MSDSGLRAFPAEGLGFKLGVVVAQEVLLPQLQVTLVARRENTCRLKKGGGGGGGRGGSVK